VLDVLPQCKLDAMSPNCVLPTVGAPEPMFQIDQSPYQCQIARALVEDGETLEHDYAVTHYSFKFKAGSVILNVIPLGLPPEHPVPSLYVQVLQTIVSISKDVLMFSFVL
jgi:hypothetical protein